MRAIHTPAICHLMYVGGRINKNRWYAGYAGNVHASCLHKKGETHTNKLFSCPNRRMRWHRSSFKFPHLIPDEIKPPNSHWTAIRNLHAIFHCEYQFHILYNTPLDIVTGAKLQELMPLVKFNKKEDRDPCGLRGSSQMDKIIIGGFNQLINAGLFVCITL